MVWGAVLILIGALVVSPKLVWAQGRAPQIIDKWDPPEALQPPSPDSRETSDKHQGTADTQKQQAAEDKRGTSESPVIVKVLDPPDANAKTDQDAEDRKERRANEGWNWRFNFLLVLVGVGQGGVLLFTALVSNKAANAAKVSADAVVSQLRAYISMRIKEGMPPRFDMKTGPWIAFDIKNTGQTPAFELTHWIQAGIGPLDFRGPFNDGSGEVKPQKTTLAPGTEINVVTEGPEPGPGDSEAFIAGTLAVYVWGEINFRDAFKNPRFHRFRYMYTFGDIRAGVQGARFCEEGNEAS